MSGGVSIARDLGMQVRSQSEGLGVGRLFHTVRHLKPVQIYSRLLTRLPRPAVARSPAPPLRSPDGPWVAPVARPPGLLGRWRVRFLNVEGEIARPEQWDDPARPKLWLYNLHYFDDLAAPADQTRRDMQRELVARWIAECPPGKGNGWEPYPLSLRIVSWIKWMLGGERLEPGWLDSLALQARWLRRHIEWHLLGNHLLANAKALAMAGMVFDGEEADEWLAAGLAILERELDEQILADGAHFELSPMYHAIILEDLLDLANMARAGCMADRAVFAGLPGRIARMRAWLAAMTHPDGGPSFFNDAALGIAATRAELEAYCGRLGLGPVAAPGNGVRHLRPSGYVRVDRGDLAAMLDLAAVGPDYIPGHAHADTLSFELSLGTERIVVNGGTSTYDPGALRAAQRATRAHSTVEVDGEDSSEVWAAFRVARRARVHDVRIVEDGGSVVVGAAHDGYRRLAGSPVHRRTWRFEGSSLTVQDEVTGLAGRPAVARFHLAPGIEVEAGTDGRDGRLRTKRGRRIAWRSSAPCRIEASRWHPEFGVSIASSMLAVPLDGPRLATTFSWE